MKKVFRVWKFVSCYHTYKADDKALESLRLGWPQECDGMTKEEMSKNGYACSDNWLVREKE